MQCSQKLDSGSLNSSRVSYQINQKKQGEKMLNKMLKTMFNPDSLGKKVNERRIK